MNTLAVENWVDVTSRSTVLAQSIRLTEEKEWSVRYLPVAPL